MARSIRSACFALLAIACTPGDPPPPMMMLAGDVGAATSSLSDPAARRERAGLIRDGAFAAGLEQGWLLAGIADAETSMSHCWSELTWACMGPASADCGGGPVVAGAGDGACSLRQGGLGMFQFDAGTYDDTLAREGTGILSIAGNVQAAVEFVVAMVIRSTHISGVDTRDQAIAWMNDVRIGNDHWDPWISTVTHYYNGCSPTSSCWSSRYAHYADNTTGVYDEMGASFWSVGNDWAAAYSHQSFPLAADPFPLAAGSTFAGYLEMRNTGIQTWHPGEVFLGTTQPRDVASPIAAPDWVNDHRAATIDRDVAPGDVGRFDFSVRAPDATGDYPQYFNLVREGVAWFSDSGGPPDAQIQIRVQSTPPPPCPDGLGAAWTCEASDRVRCENGMVFRETCMIGCSAGVCSGASTDDDGDGYTLDDCAPSDPSIHPFANDVCGDGIDQDCDGVDQPCTGDGGMPTGPGRGHVAGGCAIGSGSGSCAWLAPVALLYFVRRRMRRAFAKRAATP